MGKSGWRGSCTGQVEWQDACVELELEVDVDVCSDSEDEAAFLWHAIRAALQAKLRRCTVRYIGPHGGG